MLALTRMSAQRTSQNTSRSRPMAAEASRKIVASVVMRSVPFIPLANERSATNPLSSKKVCLRTFVRKCATCSSWEVVLAQKGTHHDGTLGRSHRGM